MYCRALLAVLALQAAPVRAATPSQQPDTIQVALLRQEIETANEYRSDLLSTIHFTLGLVGGIAILLVGYNWFVNFRLLERGRQDIQRELSDHLEKSITAALEGLDGRITTTLANATSKVESMGRDIANTQEATLKTAISGQKADVGRLAGHLRRVQLESALERAINTARYWQLKKISGNEMSYHLETLSAAIALKDEFEIAQALTNIIRLSRAGTFPFQSYIPGLVAELDGLPPKFATEVSVMRELLTKAPRV